MSGPARRRRPGPRNRPRIAIDGEKDVRRPEDKGSDETAGDRLPDPVARQGPKARGGRPDEEGDDPDRKHEKSGATRSLALVCMAKRSLPAMRRTQRRQGRTSGSQRHRPRRALSWVSTYARASALIMRGSDARPDRRRASGSTRSSGCAMVRRRRSERKPVLRIFAGVRKLATWTARAQTATRAHSC